MSIISIKDLKKSLENKPVLKGIDLEIKKGEILGLVGPSGSGKSTLLRCLNRLIEADDGYIIYKDKPITDISPIELRREIALVHQESVMLPGSVYDNISFGPNILKNVNKEHIFRCLKDVDLSEEFLEKNASKLSGGEKKRVALARALALKPNVLLLDEPTSGIDPKKVETVEKSIVNFSKKRKLTVLWVTHYIEQAKRVSFRIANLKDGLVKDVQNTCDFKWEGAY